MRVRKASLVVFVVALSAALGSPAFGVGDPAPLLHGDTSKPTVTAPAQTPSAAPVPSVVPSAAPTSTPTAAPSSTPAAPVIDELAQRALEITYAKGESKATDMHGVQDSLYKGKWYRAADEDTRRCIVKRETGGNYTSVSAGGLYRGAYQMSRSLALGATWAMQSEVSKELGDDAAALVPALRDAPTQTWNRYWQDRAFWTIWHNGDGAGHWRGSGC